MPVVEPQSAILPVAQPMQKIPEHPHTTGVVLVHGFSGSPVQMHSLAEWLYARGFAVSVPRLTGHASTLEYFAQSTALDWQHDVHVAVEALRAHPGIERVVVLGRSFGGVLALREALDYPDDIAGVICIGTPAPLPKTRMLQKVLPALMLFRKSIGKPWAKPEERTERLAEGRYLELPLRAVKEYFAALMSLTPTALAALRIPVLLLQGTDDPAIAPASVQYFATALVAAHPTTVMLEQVTHDAKALHAHPALLAAVAKFLG